MQIPCGVYRQVPEEGVVWANPARTGASLSGTGAAKGIRNYRGAPDGRSCAHADLDSAEVFGGASDEVDKREECHSDRSGVCRTAAELWGSAVLGAWLLGLDGGTGRKGGASLHP